MCAFEFRNLACLLGGVNHVEGYNFPSGHERVHRVDSTLDGDFERITYRAGVNVGESPSGFLQLMTEANEGHPPL